MNQTLAVEAPRFEAEGVICQLEEAGATLLALPGSGWSTRLRSSSLEIVRAAVESYGWTTRQIRPPIPSAARITRMDETLGWIQLIPLDRYVLRRIVGARSLVHPITERHLYPGGGWPSRSVPTTRRCNVGTPRGLTCSSRH